MDCLQSSKNIQELLQLKDDKIKFLKDQINFEQKQRKDSEANYKKELEQVETSRRFITQECNVLKNEYEFIWSEIIKNEKQNILGTSIASLFHDLRNPLSDIMNITELIELKAENEKSLISYVEMLNNASKKINHLIDDTLGFIRKAPMKIVTVNIKTIIENVIENHNISKDTKVVVSDSESEIECDVKKINIVFTNIIWNSLQAMNNKGMIKINITEKNNTCEISFEDTGTGIPEKIREKIFQPLFTTKHDGTGLGLAICIGIVNQHMGKIFVKNNPTTFTIQLPKYFKA